MRVAIMGGGFYGCHTARVLIDAGHDVTLHEAKDELFGGASGANPARLHLGFHYPRSLLTRYASQSNNLAFMDVYGWATRGIKTNVYAIAAEDSLVDFGQYVTTMAPENDFVDIEDPSEFGLEGVEGAILTGERHILINDVRKYFTELLGDRACLNWEPKLPMPTFDMLIDCTFSAITPTKISRFEPCVTFILDGAWDTAVTIMDGPFPSIYPWSLPHTVSLTSALWTPLTKECRDYHEAVRMLDDFDYQNAKGRFDSALRDMERFYPAVVDYEFRETRKAVRAMPRSAADSRLMTVSHEPDLKRIRVIAGKIDAVIDAGEQIREILS